jgi:hypothetical protein
MVAMKDDIRIKLLDAPPEIPVQFDPNLYYNYLLLDRLENKKKLKDRFKNEESKSESSSEDDASSVESVGSSQSGGFHFSQGSSVAGRTDETESTMTDETDKHDKVLDMFGDDDEIEKVKRKKKTVFFKHPRKVSTDSSSSEESEETDEDTGSESTGTDESTDEEEEMDPKQYQEEVDEYLARFRILKKANPQLDVPEMKEGDYFDLDELKRKYKRITRDEHINSSVKKYRMFLCAAFLGMEYLFTSVIGMDMTGFAKEQTKNMVEYDKMLIELGEKSYSAEESDWPVEFRLIFTILTQAAIFCVANFLMKKLGIGMDGFMGMVKQMSNTMMNNQENTTEAQPQPTTPPVQSRRMKGPSFV